MTDPAGPSSDHNAHTPPVCPRHPSVEAYVRCQRCERPVCYACQVQGAVGTQCVDCVRDAARQAPTTRSVFGGRSAGGQPVVTIGLIVLYALIYVGQLADDQVTTRLMFVPALGEHEPWRFLSAAFVHSPTSFLHIMFNGYATWICGQYLEPLLGRARFLALFLVSAIGGSVGYTLLASAPDPTNLDQSGWLTPTVGASGAVFGLFLAVVVLNRHLGREVGPMLLMIAINAALPFFVSNIAWQAHLGGAITGAVLAGLIAVLGRQRAATHWLAFGGLLLVLAGAAFVRMQSVGVNLVS